MARLSVDIGGTFTDIVLDGPGARHTRKVLTTHRAPEEAVIAGTRILLDEAKLGFSDLVLFVHGTTLATNAVIERKGAKTARTSGASPRSSPRNAPASRSRSPRRSRPRSANTSAPRPPSPTPTCSR